jgi:NADH-quinone oxidoreductase subunit N
MVSMLRATDVLAILPAVIVAVAGAATLALSRIVRVRGFPAGLCWLALLASVAIMLLAPRQVPATEPTRPTVSAIAQDSLARGATWMALLLGAGCALLTSIGQQQRSAARYSIVLFSLSGVLLTCVANDFVIVILAVPLSAVAVCAGQFLEAATPAERVVSFRSLVVIALGALCLVAGGLLVCRLAGTTNFSELRTTVSQGSASFALSGGRSTRGLPVAGEIGYVLLLAGLGTPLFAVPFQLATAEIFEESSAWSVGLLSVLPRCAALVAMIRVFVRGMPEYLAATQTALTAVALVTLLIAGSLAFWQTSLRRLLAFLVMAEAGLIAFALAAGCEAGVHGEAVRWLNSQVPGGSGAACLLFGVDAAALLGLMLILNAVEKSERRIDDLEEFTGLLSRNRIGAVAAAVLLLSLCGVPPLPGFWARVAVLQSVLSVSFSPENDFLPHQNTGYVVFALLAVAAMIAVAAPCLRLAMHLLSREPLGDGGDPAPVARLRRPGMLAGAVIAGVLFVSGFFPDFGSQLAARIAFQKPADGALAAERQGPPKKHRRGHGNEPPSDSAEDVL